MPITKASSNAVAPAAKGDLVVGNATNDSGVLAVGTTDQVLTVDSSTATGLKWATALPSQTGNSGKYLTTNGSATSWGTVSAGGMTSIASGTMSGTVVTLSSISASYKNLQLVIKDVYGASGINNIFIRFNSNAGNTYFYNKQLIGTAAWTTQAKQAYWYLTDTLPTTASSGTQVIVDIPDYASTTTHSIRSQAILNNPGAGSWVGNFTSLAYGENLAISSISIHADVNSFSGGTYILYGVN
jgi:hypothetical protein